MKIKELITILFMGLLFFQCDNNSIYTIKTEYGDIKVELFEDTPIHSENFKKLVDEGYYNNHLFHRVIRDFMIQGGDPNSKNPEYSGVLGQGGPGYTLDAEIKHLHFRGALAAARLPDGANPDRKSNGSQFYLVQGLTNLTDAHLDRAEKDVIKRKYTPEERALYLEKGGYPFIDGGYTVFGQVVEGIEVIDRIADSPVDNAARPSENVSMKIVRD